MPTSNDRKTAFKTHQQGNDIVRDLYLRVGLRELSPEAPALPQMSFQVNKVHRLNQPEGIMPRDFRVRLTGENASVKIHHLRGDLCSSLYRSIAYLLMDADPYLQIVSGCSEQALKQTLGFFDQEPLNPHSPAGIRHIDDVEKLLMNLAGALR